MVACWLPLPPPRMTKEEFLTKVLVCTFSSKRVTRRKQNVNKRILFHVTPNSLSENCAKLMAEDAEN